MATLDLSTAFRSFSMTDPSLVTFDRAYQTDPSAWLFGTPAGHALRLTGHGLSYDAQGRAQAGLVNAVTIDLDNDNPWSPDLTITGIDASAPRLDDGPAEFWHVLQGNDVIHGPVVSRGASGGNFTLVGDGVAARSGAGVGGRDVIHTGDGHVTAFGDVHDVGSPVAGTPTANYRGGNDQILGLETPRPQRLSGDAEAVWAGSTLTGGHDTILVQATFGSSATGDAIRVSGAGGALAQVVGGNDTITGGPNFRGTLVGDVMIQGTDSFVRGGADTIQGGELASFIAGDVYSMNGGQLIGGNDTLSGNGGNDVIHGDTYYAANTTITGGNDVIRGGRGDDKLVGDFGNGGRVTDGGDDRLYGDEGGDTLDGDSGDDVLNGGAGKDTLIGDQGDDQLYGGTENDNLDGGSGNDLLDGGAGADKLFGTAGDDTYFVNDAGDQVFESAGQGTDTVWSFLSSYFLGSNVENLRFNGLGSFTGGGNGLANTIQGSAETDYLYGEGGNDVLIGGGGADRLEGGTGIDTASYASATDGGVYASLQDNANSSRDARGDVYVGVENLAGSDFSDALLGDAGANRLSGGGGNDNLVGFGGADTLIGGGGADGLDGGSGNDAFVFNARDEGRDTIYGFARATGNDDRLHFEGDAFGGLPVGALSASRFTANTSGLATTASHRFVYETDTGVLRFDANGSAAGGVTEIALLTGAPVVAIDDFAIV